MEEQLKLFKDTPMTKEQMEALKKQFNDVNVVIEGVGADAEVITNENGGKQSKTPMALHLVDPKFLKTMITLNNPKIQEAILNIADFMLVGYKCSLYAAIQSLDSDITQALIRIAKVLQEGADKYEPNNWRLIPQEQHINHALIHLFAAGLGDTQDNHLDHALCRIMMAWATKPSENFSYTKYIKKAA